MEKDTVYTYQEIGFPIGSIMDGLSIKKLSDLGRIHIETVLFNGSLVDIPSFLDDLTEQDLFAILVNQNCHQVELIALFTIERIAVTLSENPKES